MAKKKSSKKKDSEAIPFESALEQLQLIVAQLEQGQLSLGESLEKYELGIQHLNRCYQALEAAERKIELLVKLDDNGNLVTRPFESTRDSQSQQHESDREDSVDDVNGLF